MDEASARLKRKRYCTWKENLVLLIGVPSRDAVHSLTQSAEEYRGRHVCGFVSAGRDIRDAQAVVRRRSDGQILSVSFFSAKPRGFILVIGLFERKGESPTCS